jgi:hypothetical protein
MTMQILRTATLAQVRDGMLAQQLDLELVRVHQDCVQRPELLKPRKVVLEIVITPTGEDPLEAVDVEFHVKQAVLPATRIVRQLKAMNRNKGFGFDADTDNIDHSPSQPRLSGIDSDGDEV